MVSAQHWLGSSFFTTDSTASPSPIGVPGAGSWATTVQLRSMTWARPRPLASVEREKNTPAAWMVFCAAWRFMQTTAGMIAVGAAAVVGADAGVVARGGAIAGVLVGAAAWAVVGGRNVVVDGALGTVSGAQAVIAASIAAAIIAVCAWRGDGNAFPGE